ncbi:hypothetical protein ACFX19_028621 [Malus domestica]
MSFSFSLARQALPDKPASKAGARQKASTGANLSRSCVFVGQEAPSTEISTTNIVLARPVGSLIKEVCQRDQKICKLLCCTCYKGWRTPPQALEKNIIRF